MHGIGSNPWKIGVSFERDVRANIFCPLKCLVINKNKIVVVNGVNVIDILIPFVKQSLLSRIDLVGMFWDYCILQYWYPLFVTVKTS